MKRVGELGSDQLFLGRAGLDDIANKENADSIHDLPQDGEVVRNEETERGTLLLQALEAVEVLSLHRDMEGRDRLETSGNVLLRGKGPCGGNPPSLAPESA